MWELLSLQEVIWCVTGATEKIKQGRVHDQHDITIVILYFV